MDTQMNDSTNNWVRGDVFSAQELKARYSIPSEELASFHNCTFIIPYRGVIVTEGEHDKSMFLLRYGTVGVYKNVGLKQEQIAEINAVNFFGEMGLINDEPRSASIIALSKDVVVYRIAQPNMPIILRNPKWAEILITRMSKNLASDNQLLAASSKQNLDLKYENGDLKLEIDKLRAENITISQNVSYVLSSILYFQTVVMGLAVVGTKGWAYLNALNRVCRKLIAHYLTNPEATERAADVKVIRECLKSIQNNSDIESVYKELDRSL